MLDSFIKTDQMDKASIIFIMGIITRGISQMASNTVMAILNRMMDRFSKDNLEMTRNQGMDNFLI